MHKYGIRYVESNLDKCFSLEEIDTTSDYALLRFQKPTVLSFSSIFLLLKLHGPMISKYFKAKAVT